MRKKTAPFPADPLWFKEAIIYQTHVKAFYDSNADGMGDFRGLSEKLDYLQALGINTLWILPFYPSPLRDDGYDIADYTAVNSSYGTLQDFQHFQKETHKRGIRLITELVLNHTSDQHAWFQKARQASPNSSAHNFYVWSDSPEKYPDARIIFKDFETSNWTWDGVAKRYFWHRFYGHQPDLNFDNPKVHQALLKVIDFWMNMGVDGLRLDAVPYLYEREGTNCENLPETMAFLTKLREHIDSKYDDRLLLAEANQWPEDAAAYFGDGNRCHMNFHFPLMPRMFMALQMEDRFPIIDILEQTPDIHESCQWATFLRNHDELTLEMVTDEERDYMYRVYARDTRARINLGIRRRLAPLCGNNRRKIELLNMLLFSLPGTPIVYYGDEIGMGDNIYLGDRNGVRTPMQWSADRNAGFSKANPQQLYLPITIDPEYSYESINVENSEKNPSSLLWWMRRVIAMRKQYKAFGRGSIEFLYPDNPKVLAFIRSYEDETILVVVNLSRYSQVAEIDLTEFAGMTPTELFSRNEFPVIRSTPYVFTLGIHDYFWLKLENQREESGIDIRLDELPAETTCRKLLDQRAKLEKSILPEYFQQCRWFGGKARKIRTIQIRESIPATREMLDARLLLVEVIYVEGNPEVYSLPVTIAWDETATRIAEEQPGAVIAKIGDNGILYDAIHDPEFRTWLFQTLINKKKVKSSGGTILGTAEKRLADASEQSQVLKAEQSNSSIIYGGEYFLKLYRRIEEGVNPDAELTRFLTQKANFEHVPPFDGMLLWQPTGGDDRGLALLQGLTQNQGDAWRLILDVLERFFERTLVQQPEAPDPAGLGLFDPTPLDLQKLEGWIGTMSIDRMTLLAERTGGMHVALASDRKTPDLAPEAFTALYQRSLYQSMRGQVRRSFQLLNKNKNKLEEVDQPIAEQLLEGEAVILERFKRLLGRKIPTERIRIHGDYHLGQILYTGRDFVIIDFEGEPARPISERRLKRSPLRDVAGMLRSIQYAVATALRTQPASSIEQIWPWAKLWEAVMMKLYWQGYQKTVEGASFLPEDLDDRRHLLEAFLLEKAAYEVGYELNNRPAWIGIPMEGMLSLLQE